MPIFCMQASKNFVICNSWTPDTLMCHGNLNSWLKHSRCITLDTRTACIAHPSINRPSWIAKSKAKGLWWPAQSCFIQQHFKATLPKVSWIKDWIHKQLNCGRNVRLLAYQKASTLKDCKDGGIADWPHSICPRVITVHLDQQIHKAHIRDTFYSFVIKAY